MTYQKLQRPTNDPRLQEITIDNTLRSKFNLLEAGATPTPTDREPKPLLVAPHAANDQYGYKRPCTGITSPYEPYICHRAHVAPQNYQSSASDLGPPRPNYNDAPVHAQSLSFHAAMADLHARGMITMADESLHIRHRMPVAQNTTSGHTLSNCSKVDQVTLPIVGPTSNAPIDFPVQAGIESPGLSPAFPGSPRSNVSIHDSNVAGGSRALTLSTAQESSYE
ncbi:uncharacterized protein FIESC28_00652 [Fusarium coffeatum]|uniref:Uncharacterized protein n=1 Tax=Fusarium coffeatum TaxID=231269 RepID=A0A366SD03_9HYPO|nr:uncharacterized protein FIESC28_00652 [Fusarium coffeatum]RBR26535.1 hypothetical protein FIESC28_00652 [Fusarium coffeatum]